MRIVWMLPLVAGLTACGTLSGLSNWFERGEVVDVVEVGRSQQCGQTGAEPSVEVFADSAAVSAWQQRSQLALVPEAALHEGGYALIRMGQQPSAGYGMAVSRTGKISGGILRVYTTFFAPKSGAAVVQMQTSPCVLVRLPRTRVDSVEVLDQNGEERASAELSR